MDHFQITPPMSTFAFGFLISQLTVVEKTDYLQDPNIKNVCIKVYARSELHADLINTVSNICQSDMNHVLKINIYRESMKELKRPF